MHRFAIIILALILDWAGMAQNVALSKKPATQGLAPEQAVAKMQAQLQDWPGLNRYSLDNAALPQPIADEKRVVFLGDSITDAWGRLPDTGTFFPGKPYVNRGISGQTTPQMLLRFEQDVVHLHPAAVILLAGTNDIAGNTGAETPEMIEDNIRAMTAIAKQSGIRMVLASILPAVEYPWRPGVAPAAEIRDVNSWMKQFAKEQHVFYLDYYSSLVDERGGMRTGTSKDGVHPNSTGYGIMAPLAEGAIAVVLTAATP